LSAYQSIELRVSCTVDMTPNLVEFWVLLNFIGESDFSNPLESGEHTFLLIREVFIIILVPEFLEILEFDLVSRLFKLELNFDPD